MFGTDTGHSTFEEQDSPVQDLTFEALEAAFEGKSMALTDAGMESLRITENGRFTRLGFILSDQFD